MQRFIAEPVSGVDIRAGCYELSNYIRFVSRRGNVQSRVACEYVSPDLIEIVLLRRLTSRSVMETCAR
jgi:hypothetical protein